MNTKTIAEIMEIYTGATGITTTCVDSQALNSSLYSVGIEFSILLKYMDFNEIQDFLSSEFKQSTELSLNSSCLYTYYTSKLIVYNIILIALNHNSKLALVAGPILTFSPTKRYIDDTLANSEYSLREKTVFFGILRDLPLASNKRICQLGKLLFTLTCTDVMNLDSFIQEVRNIPNADRAIEIRSTIDTMISSHVLNNNSDYHIFCIRLKKVIVNGDENGTIDLINQYINYIWSFTTNNDNNRSLKNICIVTCTIACNYAITVSVPYGPILVNCWNSLMKFEKLSTPNEIIIHLITTIKGFAHSVSILSKDKYSFHVNRILHYIKNHYSEKITLKQLADVIQKSPEYLSSLIKKETNRSLSNHINLIRVEESKKLLIYTNKSIQDIGYDVGYNFPNHFTTAFKKLEGMTPLEYRNIMGRIY